MLYFGQTFAASVFGIFIPLYKARIRSGLEYVTKASYIFLFRGSRAPEKAQKCAVKSRPI